MYLHMYMYIVYAMSACTCVHSVIQRVHVSPDEPNTIEVKAMDL